MGGDRVLSMHGMPERETGRGSGAQAVFAMRCRGCFGGHFILREDSLFISFWVTLGERLRVAEGGCS